MAKTIKDLRQEKGYRSAREFADALGIATSSMSRYDKDPETIPLKHAWAMADLLGCSIDEVVGREPVTAGRNELQEFYDALLPETRALVDEFIEFAQAKDEGTRRQLKAEEDRRSEDLCRFYERMLYQSAYEGGGFGDVPSLGSAMEERTAFEAFVREKAAEKRKPGIDLHCAGVEDELRGGYIDENGEPQQFSEEYIQNWLAEEFRQMEEEYAKKDEGVISGIMQAYDRLHARELRNWAVHSGEATPEQMARYAAARPPE